MFNIDDDCTVRPTGLRCLSGHGAGPQWHHLRQSPTGGRRSQLVPSTITEEKPRDYTGDPYRPALFANNMACPREAVLALGGFDERIVPFAEDNDFCFRWVRAGRLRHVPEIVVWHHAWRSPEQMERLYFVLQGNGIFYAKYLAAGDLKVLPMLLWDCYQALRSLYSARFRGVERWADERRGAFPGLPQGLRAGWRFRRTS